MVILKAENISKQYRLGIIGTGTLSHDLNRWWHKVRGKEDPYLKVGESNNRNTKGTSEYAWALKEINFEVQQGEVLGIIGKNGAGKSTLLKILSRVTTPTEGEVKTKGRIASLLEVGTGFHPEMTGRENIYLNGAILGMTKAEIKRKEDEIIEFSGCMRYIDTPVKRYSSGMRVRLAFAVAAFLEPDILVVDEVLAVGDAEFQKKAIGKMQDISKGEGRTVLFVSHNMAAVKSLCSRAMVLEHGEIVFKGETDAAVDFYLKLNSSIKIKNFKVFKEDDFDENEFVRPISIGIRMKDKSFEDTFHIDKEMEFVIEFWKQNTASQIDITLKIKDDKGNPLVTIPSSLCNDLNNSLRQEEKVIYSLIFPAFFFSASEFYMDILFVKDQRKVIMKLIDAISFNTIDEEKELGTWMGKLDTPLRMKLEWRQL